MDSSEERPATKAKPEYHDLLPDLGSGGIEFPPVEREQAATLAGEFQIQIMRNYVFAKRNRALIEGLFLLMF